MSEKLDITLDFCCTCSKQCNQLFNVNDVDMDSVSIRKKLHYSFPDLESIDANSNIQRYICDDCVDHVTMIYNFRRVFVKSIKFTQNYIRLVKQHSQNTPESAPDINLKIACTTSFANDEIYEKFLSSCESTSNSVDNINIVEPKIEPLDIENDECDELGSKEYIRHDADFFLGFEKKLDCCKICKTRRTKFKNMRLRGSYFCDICSKMCSSNTFLLNHRKKHWCTRCSKIIIKTDKMNEHMKNECKNAPKIICQVCDRVLKTNLGLKLHMRIHVEMKCQNCGMNIQKESKHVCVKILKCHKCNNLFNEGTKHVCTSFRCYVCPAMLKNKKSFQVHLKRHVYKKSFSCLKCSLKFKNKIDLNKHLKGHELFEKSNLN